MTRSVLLACLLVVGGAELAIEASDGRPSLVERLLPSHLAVGRFCPWNATPDSLEDHR